MRMNDTTMLKVVANMRQPVTWLHDISHRLSKSTDYLFQSFNSCHPPQQFYEYYGRFEHDFGDVVKVVGFTGTSGPMLALKVHRLTYCYAYRENFHVLGKSYLFFWQVHNDIIVYGATRCNDMSFKVNSHVNNMIGACNDGWWNV